MDIKKTLHYISYVNWAFLISEIILILYCFIILPENLVSIVGIVIFITGIQMGLASLSDIEKMSEKEKSRYKDINYVKKQSIIILSGVVVLVIISLLFLSLKFVFPTKNTALYNAFFDLGLDCWALILGLLCLLKNTHEKFGFVKSTNKT